MKVVALTQAYNDELYIGKCLSGVQPYVDSLIITEGSVSIHGEHSKHSTDNTEKIMKNFADEHNNVIFVKHPNIKTTTRERSEGIVKTAMLRAAEDLGLISNDDWIFTIDSDEFYKEEDIVKIVNLLKNEFKDHHSGYIEEWQFAYNMELAFKSSHGRFIRYKEGSTVATTHRLIWPDGTTPWNKKKFIIKREDHPMFHMCWTKSPWLIRDKVLSFNRPSFTTWFNNVYLEWPSNSERAYTSNSRIFPHYGNGFAEGQNEPLVEFKGTLPEHLLDLDVNFLNEIIDNKKKLYIR